MKANYNVTGEDRKQLVAIISREAGIQPVYTRMPECAFVIGNMKVTKEDIQNVAGLSRLAIPDTETDVYIAQLGGFLEYVENLKEIDTEGVAPTTYALPMQNVFREDVVKPSLDREAALSNAPMKEDGYFKVPRVLEE